MPSEAQPGSAGFNRRAGPLSQYGKVPGLKFDRFSLGTQGNRQQMEQMQGARRAKVLEAGTSTARELDVQRGGADALIRAKAPGPEVRRAGADAPIREKASRSVVPHVGADAMEAKAPGPDMQRAEPDAPTGEKAPGPDAEKGRMVAQRGAKTEESKTKGNDSQKPTGKETRVSGRENLPNVPAKNENPERVTEDEENASNEEDEDAQGANTEPKKSEGKKGDGSENNESANPQKEQPAADEDQRSVHSRGERRAPGSDQPGERRGPVGGRTGLHNRDNDNAAVDLHSNSTYDEKDNSTSDKTEVKTLKGNKMEASKSDSDKPKANKADVADSKTATDGKGDTKKDDKAEGDGKKPDSSDKSVGNGTATASKKKGWGSIWPSIFGKSTDDLKTNGTEQPKEGTGKDDKAGGNGKKVDSSDKPDSNRTSTSNKDKKGWFSGIFGKSADDDKITTATPGADAVATNPESSNAGKGEPIDKTVDNPMKMVNKNQRLPSANRSKMTGNPAGNSHN